MVEHGNLPQMGAIEDLLDRHQNRDVFGRVVELLKSSAITPFVGAGLSRPCGMPLWGQFLLELATDAEMTTEVQGWLDSGAFLEAADQLQEKLGERVVRDRIMARFGRIASIGAPLTGAIRQLPAVAFGPVVTTNFDRLLERTFLETGRSFEHHEWGWSLEASRQALVERRHILIKLHGDAEDEHSHVFTRTDYVKHYGAMDKLDATLHIPLVLARAGMSSLLFLGCSLTLDRTVEVIKTAAKQPLAAKHYAILEEARDRPSINARTRELADLGIRPLWYPHGQHTSVELLMAEFASCAFGQEPVTQLSTAHLRPSNVELAQWFRSQKNAPVLLLFDGGMVLKGKPFNVTDTGCELDPMTTGSRRSVTFALVRDQAEAWHGTTLEEAQEEAGRRWVGSKVELWGLSRARTSNQNNLTSDRKTLADILAILPDDRCMDFLRSNNFAGFSFDPHVLNPIESFLAFARRVDREFLDPPLEALKKELATKLLALMKVFKVSMYPLENGLISVPQEWERDTPERFHRVVDEIHDAAEAAVQSYEALIRAARQKLGDAS